jgi:hypothetical protein
MSSKTTELTLENLEEITQSLSQDFNRLAIRLLISLLARLTNLLLKQETHMDIV